MVWSQDKQRLELLISRKVVDSTHFTSSRYITQGPERIKPRFPPHSFCSWAHVSHIWDFTDDCRAHSVHHSTTLEGFQWLHLGFKPEFD